MRGARLMRGVVTNVNPSDWEMDLFVSSTGQTHIDVGIPGTYLHPDGHGSFCMPEPGAFVWIAEPSHVDEHVTALAYAALMDTAGTHATGREDLDMHPGDQYMGGAGGNRIIVRRGGIIEVRGSPLAQRLYLPIENIIRDIFQNYEMLGVGGHAKWLTGLGEETDAAGVPTVYTMASKRFAGDKMGVVTLTAGNVGMVDENEPDLVFSLAMYDNGEVDQEKTVGIKVTKDGNVDLMFTGNVTGVVKGTMTYTVEKAVLFRSTEKIVLEVASKFAGNVNSGKIEITPSGIRMASPTSVDKGGAGKYLVTADFLTAYIGHVHAAPGAPIDTASQTAAQLMKTALLKSE